MHERISRRDTLAIVGLTTVGALAGCTDAFGNGGTMDVTVTNLSERTVEYDVTIEGFTDTGTLDTDGTDRYEDVLDQPDSLTEYAADVAFGLPSGDIDDNETDLDDANETAPEREIFLEIASTDSPVEVNSDTIEIAVEYSDDAIALRPILPDDE